MRRRRTTAVVRTASMELLPTKKSICGKKGCDMVFKNLPPGEKIYADLLRAKIWRHKLWKLDDISGKYREQILKENEAIK